MKIGNDGFLPATPPLVHAPKGYEALEQIGNDRPSLLKEKKFRNTIQYGLPELHADQLTNEAEIEWVNREALFNAAGYVWENWEVGPEKEIPAHLARLAANTSRMLGLKPILAYAQYALTNWRLAWSVPPPRINNIRLLSRFTYCDDEWGFIAPHIEIEFLFQGLITSAKATQDARKQGNIPELKRHLHIITHSMRAVLGVLKEIPEVCNPINYYTKVRPWINGFTKHSVIYKGVAEFGEKPQSFRGETGAQSIGIPCMDALLGVEHNLGSDLSIHLAQLRSYRPPDHRAFLRDIENSGALRPFIVAHAADGELVDCFNACVEPLIEFREVHFGYTQTYIAQQRQVGNFNLTTVGTGGTDYTASLLQHIEDTRRCLVRKTA